MKENAKLTVILGKNLTKHFTWVHQATSMVIAFYGRWSTRMLCSVIST